MINTAAVRDEGTTISYVPLAYPAVADRHVVDALARAAKSWVIILQRVLPIRKMHFMRRLSRIICPTATM